MLFKQRTRVLTVLLIKLTVKLANAHGKVMHSIEYTNTHTLIAALRLPKPTFIFTSLFVRKKITSQIHNNFPIGFYR
jgi:hypothetical protein